jgi:hypothetical protein
MRPVGSIPDVSVTKHHAYGRQLRDSLSHGNQRENISKGLSLKGSVKGSNYDNLSTGRKEFTKLRNVRELEIRSKDTNWPSSTPITSNS